MTFTIEFEREDDGRWLAEVLELPGVLAYGQTSDEAIAKAQALALRALADRLEHSEGAADLLNIHLAAPRARGPLPNRNPFLAALPRIGWNIQGESRFQKNPFPPDWSG